MSRRWKRYADEEKATMQRMWAEGSSIAEIAEALGRTEFGVHGYISIHRDDHPYRRMRTSAEEREQMVALRDEGMTYRLIGRYIGVSYETARRHYVKREESMR